MCSPGSLQLEALTPLFPQNPLGRQRSAVGGRALGASAFPWPTAWVPPCVGPVPVDTFAQGRSQGCCDRVVTRSWHFTGLLSTFWFLYTACSPFCKCHLILNGINVLIRAEPLIIFYSQHLCISSIYQEESCCH